MQIKLKQWHGPITGRRSGHVHTRNRTRNRPAPESGTRKICVSVVPDRYDTQSRNRPLGADFRRRLSAPKSGLCVISISSVTQSHPRLERWTQVTINGVYISWPIVNGGFMLAVTVSDGAKASPRPFEVRTTVVRTTGFEVEHTKRCVVWCLSTCFHHHHHHHCKKQSRLKNHVTVVPVPVPEVHYHSNRCIQFDFVY